MHPFRERVGILTGALIVAEALLSTHGRWAIEAEEMADSGRLLGPLITVVVAVAVLALVNGIIAYGVFFKCVYFGVRFESNEEIKTEGGWCFKMAMIATACALIVFWLVILIF